MWQSALVDILKMLNVAKWRCGVVARKILTDFHVVEAAKFATAMKILYLCSVK